MRLIEDRVPSVLNGQHLLCPGTAHPHLSGLWWTAARAQVPFTGESAFAECLLLLSIVQPHLPVHDVPPQ